jgi:hypothetical protein
VLTRGRTRAPGRELPLEASIRAAPRADLALGANPEDRSIVTLCVTPISLAELAARMLLPVGVVRILVADLVAADAIVVGGAATADAARDPALLERLRDGIRAL